MSHSVPLREKSFTKIYPDMGPPAKLSYRSAIHKKVVFGAGDAWTLPQIQGEVGGDQEPPGNTSRYSCVFNTSHTVLGDMPDFYQKLVCITRHVIQFYQRPGWNTEHTNSLLMWQWHHFCFEVTRKVLRPGWNCRHGKLFTQRPGWNKRILRKIQCVLIKSPVTCIQDERVIYILIQ